MGNELKERLSHVFWMGGSPSSGKSSIATVLAEAYDIRVYHVDEAFDNHRERVTPAEQPMLLKWMTTPWNELWMRPVSVLLKEAIAYHEELFDMILDDLLSLAGRKPILVEGTSLLPERVHELLSGRQQALWVIPTDRFQKAQYADRGAWVEGLLRECDNPERVFINWMDRDLAFTKWMTAQISGLGLAYIEVDGKRSVAENAGVAARHFGLVKGLVPAPRRHNGGMRAALGSLSR